MNTGMRSMGALRSMPPLGMPFQADKEGFDIVLPSDPASFSRSPIVVVLFNRRGSGKTTLLVYLAMFQRERYLRHGRRCVIWANFHMKIADRQDGYICEKIMSYDPELIDELMDDRVYKLVVIDEIQKAFPSIRGASNYNQEWRRFLEDIRKTNTEVVCATQFIHLLDSGHLLQADLLCKPYLRHGPKPGQAYCLVEVWDYWGNWTGDDRRKWWPPQPYNIDWTLTIPNVHLAWPHFSSKEIIPPSWMRFRDRLLQYQGFETGGKDDGNTPSITVPWKATRDKPPTAQEFLDSLRQQKVVVITDDFIQVVRRVTKKATLGMPGVSRYLEGLGMTLTDIDGQPVAKWSEA